MKNTQKNYKKKIKVVYNFVDSPEAEHRLNRAFDVLLEKVVSDDLLNKKISYPVKDSL
jgi:hypothetical protein